MVLLLLVQFLVIFSQIWVFFNSLLKADQKALNRAVNNRSVEFAHAFVAAAERGLPAEVFSQLEQRAALMLETGSVG